MAGSNDDTTRQPHDGPTEKKARRVHDAAEGIEQQAERLARSLGESAHHVQNSHRNGVVGHHL